MPLDVADFEQTLALWAENPQQFQLADWARLRQAHTPFAFASYSLPVDDALWGGFWQGDVIAPGYTLPALELAYLRLTRLDVDEADTPIRPEFLASPTAYLTAVQTALDQPPQALWLSLLGGVYLLGVAVSPWCIWLAEGHIQAAYVDVPPPPSNMRQFLHPSASPPTEAAPNVSGPSDTLRHGEKLDRFIQRQRAQ